VTQEVTVLDTKEFEYSILDIKAQKEAVDKRNISICVEKGNAHVYLVSYGIAIKIKSEDILYIVNLLRGTVVSKLNNAEVMLTGLCDQYMSELRENKKLIELFSNSAENVFDQVTKDTEWSINDDQCVPSTELCNLIHKMAVICRIALIEKGK
jgi:hypothetical protein